MRWLGLVNTHGSLILTYLTFGLPLAIWLLKGFYDNIPIQLEQAARIDGATRFQAFLLIVSPLSVPGIIATAIYSFILAWNEYVFAYTLLSSKDKLTLPIGLQHFFTEFATDWPGLMAASSRGQDRPAAYGLPPIRSVRMSLLRPCWSPNSRSCWASISSGRSRSASSAACVKPR